MNNLVKVIVAFLTLGLSEAITSIRNAKDEKEFRYTPKSKRDSSCKYAKRCKDWECCMQTEESCKSVKRGQCPAGGCDE